MTHGNDSIFEKGSPTATYNPSTGETLPLEHRDGLTKREHFAGLAMSGFIAAHSEGSYVADFRDETLGGKCVAKAAVMFADALIDALNAKD